MRRHTWGGMCSTTSPCHAAGSNHRCTADCPASTLLPLLDMLMHTTPAALCGHCHVSTPDTAMKLGTKATAERNTHQQLESSAADHCSTSSTAIPPPLCRGTYHTRSNPPSIHSVHTPKPPHPLSHTTPTACPQGTAATQATAACGTRAHITRQHDTAAHADTRQQLRSSGTNCRAAVATQHPCHTDAPPLLLVHNNNAGTQQRSNSTVAARQLHHSNCGSS
jgi:hypothetical protein